MNNSNPPSTTNRRKQMANRMGTGLVLGVALGAAIGNVALGLAIGILIGGAGALWRTKRNCQ
ncbi:MAG TPA: hypothetical protein PKZ84_18290 [Anaerolineae bacterium]|nr:hypothetical protein [Anaerolineae bacterium]HQI85626.1 hypothetical protein [Anaerolineae bacterium]